MDALNRQFWTKDSFRSAFNNGSDYMTSMDLHQFTPSEDLAPKLCMKNMQAGMRIDLILSTELLIYSMFKELSVAPRGTRARNPQNFTKGFAFGNLFYVEGAQRIW